MDTFHYFDSKIYYFFLENRNDFLIYFFKIFTFLGNVEFISPLIILIIIFLFFKYKQAIVPFIVSFASSGLITYFLKIYLARERPLGGLLIEESFSFPSGHATVAFGVYGFLLYLSASYFFLRKKRLYFYLSIFIFSLLILLIGLSRLYLGVHYATDVLFGYFVGFCGVLLGIYFLKNINVNFLWKKEKKVLL